MITYNSCDAAKDNTMKENGYSMSSTAFTHEDREDDQLVSVDDLNMEAESEAKEDHE